MKASGLAALGLDARKELTENPRLRWGLVAIGAILALYFWLLLDDWRVALADDYRAERQRLDRILSLADQDYWLARAEAASEARRTLEARLPEAETLGLAQASVQSWARELAAVYGDAVRVRSEAPARMAGERTLWRVPVVFSGALDPPQVLQLIQRIEQQANLVGIEQALIINRANRTFSLTAVAWYRIVEEGGDGPV